MEDLTRLIISDERIENIKNNNLELSKEEAHYINKVMRIKNGKEIFITNGKGSLWKAIKVNNDCLEIIQLKKPYLFQEQEIFLLGIAVVIPKSGFEDILKMCTEIGIDFIQPLFSERQVNKNLNFSRKLLRWNLIINEAVEQSERLWKPSILNGMDIIEWLKSRDNQEKVSISITREETIYDLNQWLRKQQEFGNKKGGIFWNVIGPEGGWSAKEIDFFKKNNIVSKWFLKSEICVVCSRWQEPFGRTALEASSSGCAVIVTKKGGLPEASPKAIKLKNLTVSNLQKKLFKLIQNKKFKKSLQSKIYNNFYLTNEYISNKVDEYRSFLIKN